MLRHSVAMWLLLSASSATAQVVSVGGFWASDDLTRHAVVASNTNNGILTDAWWKQPGVLLGSAPLPCGGGVAGAVYISLDAWYSSNNKHRNAVTANSANSVGYQTWLANGSGGACYYTNPPGLVAVAGHHSTTDGLEHILIVDGNGGELDEWQIGANGPLRYRALAFVSGYTVLDAASFHLADGMEHAVLACSDGQLRQMDWSDNGALPMPYTLGIQPSGTGTLSVAAMPIGGWGSNDIYDFAAVSVNPGIMPPITDHYYVQDWAIQDVHNWGLDLDTNTGNNTIVDLGGFATVGGGLLKSEKDLLVLHADGTLVAYVQNYPLTSSWSSYTVAAFN